MRAGSGSRRWDGRPLPLDAVGAGAELHPDGVGPLPVRWPS
jgi:hypothetical protein